MNRTGALSKTAGLPESFFRCQRFTGDCYHFLFLYLGRQTYAGDYYGWQIRKSVFNMQYVIEQVGRMLAGTHFSN